MYELNKKVKEMDLNECVASYIYYCVDKCGPYTVQSVIKELTSVGIDFETAFKVLISETNNPNSNVAFKEGSSTELVRRK